MLAEVRGNVRPREYTWFRGRPLARASSGMRIWENQSNRVVSRGMLSSAPWILKVRAQVHWLLQQQQQQPASKHV